jgi:predicted transcriptional regulator
MAVVDRSTARQTPGSAHTIFRELLASLESVRTDSVTDQEQNEGDSFAQVIADFINRTDAEHATLAIGMLRQYLKHFDQFDLANRVDQLAGQVHSQQNGHHQSNAENNSAAKQTDSTPPERADQSSP